MEYYTKNTNLMHSLFLLFRVLLTTAFLFLIYRYEINAFIVSSLFGLGTQINCIRWVPYIVVMASANPNAGDHNTFNFNFITHTNTTSSDQTSKFESSLCDIFFDSAEKNGGENADHLTYLSSITGSNEQNLRGAYGFHGGQFRIPSSGQLSDSHNYLYPTVGYGHRYRRYKHPCDLGSYNGSVAINSSSPLVDPAPEYTGKFEKIEFFCGQDDANCIRIVHGYEEEEVAQRSEDSTTDSTKNVKNASVISTFLTVPLHFTSSFKGFSHSLTGDRFVHFTTAPTSMTTTSSLAEMPDSNTTLPNAANLSGTSNKNNGTASLESSRLSFFGRRFLIAAPNAKKLASRGRGRYFGAEVDTNPSRSGLKLRFAIATLISKPGRILRTDVWGTSTTTTTTPLTATGTTMNQATNISDLIDIPLVTPGVEIGGGYGPPGTLRPPTDEQKLPPLRPLIFVSLSRTSTRVINTFLANESDLFHYQSHLGGDTEVIINDEVAAGFLIENSHRHREPCEEGNCSSVVTSKKNIYRLSRGNSIVSCGSQLPMPPVPKALPSIKRRLRSCAMDYQYPKTTSAFCNGTNRFSTKEVLSIPSMSTYSLSNLSDTAAYQLGQRSLSLTFVTHSESELGGSRSELCKPHIYHAGHVYSTRPIRSGVPEYFYSYFSVARSAKLEMILNPEGIMARGIKDRREIPFQPTSTAPQTTSRSSDTATHGQFSTSPPPSTTDASGGKRAPFHIAAEINSESASAERNATRSLNERIQRETQKFILGIDERELCSWLVADKHITSWGPLRESLPIRACDQIVIIGAPSEFTLRHIERSKPVPPPMASSSSFPFPPPPPPPSPPPPAATASKSIAVFTANLTKIRPIGMPHFSISKAHNGSINGSFVFRGPDVDSAESLESSDDDNIKNGLPTRNGKRDNSNNEVSNAMYPADLFIDWRSDYSTPVSRAYTAGRPKSFAGGNQYENINSVVCLVGDQSSYNMTHVPSTHRLVLSSATLRPAALTFITEEMEYNHPENYEDREIRKNSGCVGQPYRCYAYDTVDDLHFACNTLPSCVGFTTIRMAGAVERPLCMYLVSNVTFLDIVPYQRIFYQKPKVGDVVCAVRLINTTLLLADALQLFEQNPTTSPNNTFESSSSIPTQTTIPLTTKKPSNEPNSFPSPRADQTSGMLSIYLLQSAMAQGVAVVRINGQLVASCGEDKPFAGGFMSEDGRCDQWALCYSSREPLNASIPPIITVTPTSLLPQGTCEHSFGVLVAFEADEILPPIVFEEPPIPAPMFPHPGLPLFPSALPMVPLPPGEEEMFPELPWLPLPPTESLDPQILPLFPSNPTTTLPMVITPPPTVSSNVHQKHLVNIEGYESRTISRTSGHHNDPIRVFVFRGDRAALYVAQTAHGSFHMRRGVTSYRVPATTVSLRTQASCQHCGGGAGFYGGMAGTSGQCEDFYFCGGSMALAGPQSGSCIANGLQNEAESVYTGYITIELNMTEIGRQSLDALTGNIGCDGFLAKLYVKQAGNTPLFPFLGEGGFPKILIVVPLWVTSAGINRETGIPRDASVLSRVLNGFNIITDSNDFTPVRIDIYYPRWSVLASWTENGKPLQTQLTANTSFMCIVDHAFDEGPIICTFFIPQNATHVKVRAAQTDFIEKEMTVEISLDGFTISASDTCGGSRGADGSLSGNYNSGSTNHLANNFGFRAGRAGECETFYTCTDRDLYDTSRGPQKELSIQGSVVITMSAGMRNRGCNYIAAVVVEFSNNEMGFSNSLLDAVKNVTETALLPAPAPPSIEDTSSKCSEASQRHYRCPGEDRTVPSEKVCDGVQDCFTGADELLCSRWVELEKGEVFCEAEDATTTMVQRHTSFATRHADHWTEENCPAATRENCQRRAMLNNSYAFSYYARSGKCIIYSHSLSIVNNPSAHLCRLFPSAETTATTAANDQEVETLVLLPRGPLSFHACRSSIHCSNRGVVTAASYANAFLNNINTDGYPSSKYIRTGTIYGVGAHTCRCDCFVGWTGPRCQYRNQLNRIASITLLLNATIAPPNDRSTGPQVRFTSISGARLNKSIAVRPFPPNLHLLGKAVELENNRVKGTCRETAPLVGFDFSNHDSELNALVQVECTLRVKLAGPLARRPAYRSKLYAEEPIVSPQPWAAGGSGERTNTGEFLTQEEDAMLQRHYRFLVAATVGEAAVNEKLKSQRYQSNPPVPAVLSITPQSALDTWQNLKVKGVECSPVLQEDHPNLNSALPIAFWCWSNNSLFSGRLRVTIQSALNAYSADITLAQTRMPTSSMSGSSRRAEDSDYLRTTQCIFAQGPRVGGCATSICVIEVPPLPATGAFEGPLSFNSQVSSFYTLNVTNIRLTKDVRTERRDTCSQSTVLVESFSSLKTIYSTEYEKNNTTSETFATTKVRSLKVLLAGIIMAVMLLLNLIGLLMTCVCYKRGLKRLIVAQGPPTKSELFERVRMIEQHVEKAKAIKAKRAEEESMRRRQRLTELGYEENDWRLQNFPLPPRRLGGMLPPFVPFRPQSPSFTAATCAGLRFLRARLLLPQLRLEELRNLEQYLCTKRSRQESQGRFGRINQVSFYFWLYWCKIVRPFYLYTDFFLISFIVLSCLCAVYIVPFIGGYTTISETSVNYQVVFEEYNTPLCGNYPSLSADQGITRLSQSGVVFPSTPGSGIGVCDRMEGIGGTQLGYSIYAEAECKGHNGTYSVLVRMGYTKTECFKAVPIIINNGDCVSLSSLINDRSHTSSSQKMTSELSTVFYRITCTTTQLAERVALIMEDVVQGENIVLPMLEASKIVSNTSGITTQLSRTKGVQIRTPNQILNFTYSLNSRRQMGLGSAPSIADSLVTVEETQKVYFRDALTFTHGYLRGNIMQFSTSFSPNIVETIAALEHLDGEDVRYWQIVSQLGTCNQLNSLQQSTHTACYPQLLATSNLRMSKSTRDSLFGSQFQKSNKRPEFPSVAELPIGILFNRFGLEDSITTWKVAAPEAHRYYGIQGSPFDIGAHIAALTNDGRVDTGASFYAISMWLRVNRQTFGFAYGVTDAIECPVSFKVHGLEKLASVIDGEMPRSLWRKIPHRVYQGLYIDGRQEKLIFAHACRERGVNFVEFPSKMNHQSPFHGSNLDSEAKDSFSSANTSNMTDIFDSKWHHIVLSVSAYNKRLALTLIIDGERQSTKYLSSNPPPPISDPTHIESSLGTSVVTKGGLLVTGYFSGGLYRLQAHPTRVNHAHWIATGTQEMRSRNTFPLTESVVLHLVMVSLGTAALLFFTFIFLRRKIRLIRVENGKKYKALAFAFYQAQFLVKVHGGELFPYASTVGLHPPISTSGESGFGSNPHSVHNGTTNNNSSDMLCEDLAPIRLFTALKWSGLSVDGFREVMSVLLELYGSDEVSTKQKYHNANGISDVSQTDINTQSPNGPTSPKAAECNERPNAEHFANAAASDLPYNAALFGASDEGVSLTPQTISAVLPAIKRLLLLIYNSKTNRVARTHDTEGKEQTAFKWKFNWRGKPEPLVLDLEPQIRPDEGGSRKTNKNSASSFIAKTGSIGRYPSKQATRRKDSRVFHTGIRQPSVHNVLSPTESKSSLHNISIASPPAGGVVPVALLSRGSSIHASNQFELEASLEVENLVADHHPITTNEAISPSRETANTSFKVTPMPLDKPHPFSTFTVAEWNREALLEDRLLEGPFGGSGHFFGSLWALIRHKVDQFLWMKLFSSFSTKADEKLFDNFFDGTQELLHGMGGPNIGGGVSKGPGGAFRDDIDSLVANASPLRPTINALHSRAKKSRTVAVKRHNNIEYTKSGHRQDRIEQFTAGSSESDNSRAEGQPKQVAVDYSAMQKSPHATKMTATAEGAGTTSHIPPTPTPTKGFANRIGAAVAVSFLAISTLQQIYLWQVSFLSLPVAFVSVYGPLLRAATLDVSGLMPLTIEFSPSLSIFSPSATLSSLDGAHMLPIIRFALPLFSFGVLIMSLKASSRWFWISAYKMCLAIDLRAAVVVLRGMRGPSRTSSKKTRNTEVIEIHQNEDRHNKGPDGKMMEDKSEEKVDIDHVNSEPCDAKLGHISIPVSLHQIEYPVTFHDEDQNGSPPTKIQEANPVAVTYGEVEENLENSHSFPKMVEGDDIKIQEHTTMPALRSPRSFSHVVTKDHTTPTENAKVEIIESEELSLPPLLTHLPRLTTVALPSALTPLSVLLSSVEARKIALLRKDVAGANKELQTVVINNAGRLPLSMVFASSKSGSSSKSPLVRVSNEKNDIQVAGTTTTTTNEKGEIITQITIEHPVSSGITMMTSSVSYAHRHVGSTSFNRFLVKISTRGTIIVQSDVSSQYRFQLHCDSSSSINDEYNVTALNHLVSVGKVVAVTAAQEEVAEKRSKENEDSLTNDSNNASVKLVKDFGGLLPLHPLNHFCVRHPSRPLSAHFAPNPDHAGTAAEFPQCCAMINGQRCRKRAPRSLVFVCGHAIVQQPRPKLTSFSQPNDCVAQTCFSRDEVCSYALCFDHYQPPCIRMTAAAIARGMVRALIAKGVVWCCGVLCLGITILCYVPFLFTGFMILSSHEFYIATFAGVYHGLNGGWRNEGISGEGGFFPIEGARRGVVEVPEFSADVVGTSLGFLFPIAEGRREGIDWGIYFSLAGIVILGIIYPCVLVVSIRRRLTLLKTLVQDVTSEAFSSLFSKTTHNYMQSLKQQEILKTIHSDCERMRIEQKQTSSNGQVHNATSVSLAKNEVPNIEMRSRPTIIEIDNLSDPLDPYAASKVAKATSAAEQKRSSHLYQHQTLAPGGKVNVNASYLPLFMISSNRTAKESPSHPFNNSGNEEIQALTRQVLGGSQNSGHGGTTDRNATAGTHSSFTAADGSSPSPTASSSTQQQASQQPWGVSHNLHPTISPMLTTQPGDMTVGTKTIQLAVYEQIDPSHEDLPITDCPEEQQSTRDEEDVTLPPPSLQTVEGSAAFSRPQFLPSSLIGPANPLLHKYNSSSTKRLQLAGNQQQIVNYDDNHRPDSTTHYPPHIRSLFDLPHRRQSWIGQSGTLLYTEGDENTGTTSTPDMGKSVLGHLGIEGGEDLHSSDSYPDTGAIHLPPAIDSSTEMVTGTETGTSAEESDNIARRHHHHDHNNDSDSEGDDPIEELLVRMQRGINGLSLFRDVTKNLPWQPAHKTDVVDVAATVRQWYSIAAFDYYSVLSYLCSYHLDFRRVAKTTPSLSKLIAPLIFLMLRFLVCLPAVLLPPESLTQRVGCSLFEVIFIFIPVCHFVYTERPAAPIATALLAAAAHQVLFLGVHSINMADRFDSMRKPPASGSSLSFEFAQFPDEGFPFNPTYDEVLATDIVLIALTGMYLTVTTVVILHLLVLSPLWDALFARPSFSSLWAYAASFPLKKLPDMDESNDRSKRKSQETKNRWHPLEVFKGKKRGNKKSSVGGRGGIAADVSNTHVHRTNSLVVNRNISDEYTFAAQVLSPLLQFSQNRIMLNDVHATASISYLHRKAVLSALRHVPFCYHPALEVPLYVDPTLSLPPLDVNTEGAFAGKEAGKMNTNQDVNKHKGIFSEANATKSIDDELVNTPTTSNVGNKNGLFQTRHDGASSSNILPEPKININAQHTPAQPQKAIHSSAQAPNVHAQQDKKMGDLGFPSSSLGRGPFGNPQGSTEREVSNGQQSQHHSLAHVKMPRGALEELGHGLGLAKSPHLPPHRFSARAVQHSSEESLMSPMAIFGAPQFRDEIRNAYAAVRGAQDPKTVNASQSLSLEQTREDPMFPESKKGLDALQAHLRSQPPGQQHYMMHFSASSELLHPEQKRCDRKPKESGYSGKETPHALSLTSPLSGGYFCLPPPVSMEGVTVQQASSPPTGTQLRQLYHSPTPPPYSPVGARPSSVQNTNASSAPPTLVDRINDDPQSN